MESQDDQATYLSKDHFACSSRQFSLPGPLLLLLIIGDGEPGKEIDKPHVDPLAEMNRFVFGSHLPLGR